VLSLRINWAVPLLPLLLSCDGQEPLHLLTILELLFEPTLVSDYPLLPSAKCHCSASHQSSVALNRNRDQKFEPAMHDLHVINYDKLVILLCTKWAWATFFNAFVAHSSIFRKLHHFTISNDCTDLQWRTEGRGFTPPPPKLQSFAKAEPNSQFVWVSFICKLSGTAD
jgi:hypothetical protein